MAGTFSLSEPTIDPPQVCQLSGAIEDNWFTIFFSTLEAHRVGVKDSHASVWTFALELRIPTLWCGPLSWVKDFHALLWPLKLGLRAPTLQCGPLSWG